MVEIVEKSEVKRGSFFIFTSTPIYRGDNDLAIKTAKCSFLRTNMQCGFIKVIRMKRGSSNCKMIVAS